MRLFTLAASSSLQAAPGGGCSPRAVAAARGTVQGGMAGAADVLSLQPVRVLVRVRLRTLGNRSIEKSIKEPDRASGCRPAD